MNWLQLGTLLWLRRRLTRNQWARGGWVGAVVAAVLGVGAIAVALISFATGFAVGRWALDEVAPRFVGLSWLAAALAFLLTWTVGVLNELQRSETIDLQRLMHLPVRLGQIFALNYLASHLALSIVLFVPGMVGASIGLALGRGARMLWLIPMGISFVLMVTAWTYRFRGWLAALVTNPRRRRMAIMASTMVLVLGFQLPNLYFNVLHRSLLQKRHRDPAQRTRPENPFSGFDFGTLETVEPFAPPLWLFGAATELARGSQAAAALRTAACALFAALGLVTGYRSTLRFYSGSSGGAAVAPPPSRRDRRRRNLIAARIGFLPEQAQAVALASLRSMTRAPEVKVAWLGSTALLALMGGVALSRFGSEIPASARPALVLGLGAFSIFMGQQFLTNGFGYDRDAFRSWVLSPVPRHWILLGKNVAVSILLGGVGSAATLGAAIWLRMRPVAILAAALELLIALFTALCVGNVFSILAPYRIQPGSLRASKASGKTLLTVFAFQLTFPLLLAPAFLPVLLELGLAAAQVRGASLAGLAAAMLFAGAAGLLYAKSLVPLGRLLQRREQRMLSAVTSEVE